MINSMINMHNGIITIALGKKYAKQAIFLARSCMINSPHVLRAVVTDTPDLLNDYYDIIIPYNNKEDPFSVKTRLYELSPFEKTLYIDADSLVYNNVDSFFNNLDENGFVYFGYKINEGIWYYDVKYICNIIKSSWIPKFNSGMLLFKKCDIAKLVFETAYYYFINHKNEGIEIPFFRGKNYPDEPMFSISLAKNNVEPVNDYGRFSRTLIKTKRVRLNILLNLASFIKDDRLISPLIVHFCGRKGGIYYFIEKLRLSLLSI